ncbi:CHASE3 domain-containing protein [Acidovorax sp. MR-S7]|uniref:CHASE3 domain-containing protein n=1 Tax=Acidovorax sp. MR-S7 TaxID=1268622 RepID=UPI0003A4B649|nr:CHASE3 domain-containing protein [Acidovorax sp. MR-S7]GAD23564.1 hypothetical protein AVS7_03324 [Acidovorax sp. MR-S7]
MPARQLLGFVLAATAALLIAVLAYRSSDERATMVDSINSTVDGLLQVQLVWAYLKNAESSQRGYMLTGDEQRLDLYTAAQAALPVELEKLQRFAGHDPMQRRRLDQLQGLARQKMAELNRMIALQREGRRDEALSVLRGEGNATMDTMRGLVREMQNAERQELADRRRAWEDAFGLSAYITWGSTAVLLLLICASAVMAYAEHRSREVENWIKGSLVGLGLRLQGEQRVHELAAAVVEFLATRLDAKVGAMYVTQGHGVFERMAGYALAPDAGPASIRAGEGLAGQALQARALQHVRNVPAGYLPVTSGTGRASPAELVVVPVVLSGVALAVVELGLFRQLRAEELDSRSPACWSPRERRWRSPATAVRPSKPWSVPRSPAGSRWIWCSWTS